MTDGEELDGMEDSATSAGLMVCGIVSQFSTEGSVDDPGARDS